MRKQQELVVQKVAPRASVAVAQLHKIDGTVKFGAPAKRLHFPHARIDLYEGTWAQQRIEGVILQAHIAVLAVPDVQVLVNAIGTSPQSSTMRERRLVLS